MDSIPVIVDVLPVPGGPYTSKIEFFGIESTRAKISI